MNIYILLLAITLAHTLHALMEPMGMMKKLDRLTDAVKGKKLKPYGVNIDTRAKSYAIGYGILTITTLVFYWIVGLFSVRNDTAVVASIFLIAIVELINTALIDKYHVDIEKLIKKFSKNN